MADVTNQSRSKVEGDLTGRDKITTIHHHAPLTKIQTLYEKLKSEFENEQVTDQTIADLERYYKKQTSDGIEGLEDKLGAAGLEHTYLDAID